MEYDLRIDRLTGEIETNVSFAELNGTRYYCEGYVFQDVSDVVTGAPTSFAAVNGAFNLITCEPGKRVRAVNDRFGILNLFYCVTPRFVDISNNFWHIAQRHFRGAESIDYSELRRFIFFIGCSPDYRTFITGINILPPASVFAYDFTTNTVSLDRYWTYARRGGTDVLEDAVDQAYEAIDRNVKCIAEYFPERRFLFGNSGGLDSRLIPHFARRHGLDLTGFTVLTKRNRLGLKTGTFLASSRVQKHYGFPQRYLGRMPANFGDRLLLDVRNAPVTSCNMLDNPVEHLADFRGAILIYGNPAYLIGHETWRVSQGFKNVASWNYFLQYLLRMWNVNQQTTGELSRCVTVDQFFEAAEVYRPIYEQYKCAGHIQLFQQAHYRSMDVTAHAGGFESVNRTLLSLPLYYPFMDECSCQWDDQLLLNRAILRELNRRVDARLSRAHDQEFRFLDRPKALRRWRSRIEARFGLRSSGMENTAVVRDEAFGRFAHQIMGRENPLFEPLGDAHLVFERVIASGLFAESLALNFLKVKKMLDILFYEEFGGLDRKSFDIV